MVAGGVAIARAVYANAAEGSAERASEPVLAAALQADYSLTGQVEKLREAVTLTGEAADLTPLGAAG